MTENQSIRNFCIIAHIDHGKSTLADRILDLCHTIPKQKMRDQVLDRMDLERERGITIKAKAVRLEYFSSQRNSSYVFNMIDTPGHADFSYEVSRSLAACEGAILVIDATQGVEAQTLAHTNIALAEGLAILPVINKIDLPSANPDRVCEEIENVLGPDHLPIALVSAKLGKGVEELLEKVIDFIPPPQGQAKKSLKALVFDSIYDSYRGVLPFIRIFEGLINKGIEIMIYSNKQKYQVIEIGIFNPDMKEIESLGPGEVGYISCNIKAIQDCRVGDTITLAINPTSQAVPGYKKAKPMVFCSFYPINAEGYEILKEALEKLQLNDASLMFEPDVSEALGFGFRCGFLGLLHMEIIQERIEREFDIEVVATAPHVVYHVLTKNGEIIEVKSPRDFPSAGEIEEAEEPIVEMKIITPSTAIGGVMDLCQSKRGVLQDMTYLDPNTVIIRYHLPMAEILFDFYNRLKSVSRGYASMDYEFFGYASSNLVKVDILVSKEKVDGLSFISHEENATRRSRELVTRLRKLIPRQMFTVSVQAAIGGKIIAREDVAALRKDVLAKCYGGDITRKRKLLEKQKEGKKRMKAVGKISLPQEAFLAVLQTEEQ
jgi:GTP-binding protein LepA